MLIAFLILAAVVFVPVWWVIAMANAMSMRVSGVVTVLQVVGTTLVIAFVGTLIFGGIWALLAPLFGG